MSETIWQGASVLLFDKGAPIFTLKIEDNYCDLSGVGGKVEAGETHRQCVIRESLEETGAELSIVDVPKCIYMDFEGNTQTRDSDSGKLAQVHKAAISPQGKAWDFTLSPQKLRVDVFLGKLNQAPQAIEIHPAFIAIVPEILSDILQNGFNISKAQSENTVRIVGGELPENTPQQAFISGSFEALFIALDKGLEKFLEDAAKIVGEQK